MEHAKGDIDARMLREQQVEAKRVIEALDSALLEDGAALLAEAEIAVLNGHRDKLEQLIESASRDELKTQIEILEAAGEDYVARRMNASIRQALAGKQVDEVEL